jgi:hypothetical protein
MDFSKTISLNEDYSYSGECDPVALVQAGLCDPVRLFVKDEPHNIVKLSEGRVRLIMSVSLVDQLVERLLYTEQNKAEIKAWQEIPSKPGIGLHDDGIQAILDSVSPHYTEAAEADVSGFDWSVQEWELNADAEMRIMLAFTANKEARVVFDSLVRARTYCLARTLFSLSDGRLIAQRKPGIQLSGSFNTSSTNSRIRALLTRLVGAHWCVAMGDDCVESYVEGAIERYNELGHTVKFYKKCENDQFEFCSQVFDVKKRVAWPASLDKMLVRLLSHKLPTEEEKLGLTAQFLYEARHSPQLQEALYMLLSVGWLTDKLVTYD